MSELTPNQVYDIIFPRSIREEVDEFKERECIKGDERI